MEYSLYAATNMDCSFYTLPLYTLWQWSEGCMVYHFYPSVSTVVKCVYTLTHEILFLGEMDQ